MDEKSLADKSQTDVSVVDSSPEVTPQNFSFEDFLNGVRPTRRSVQLFPRADLIARLEEIIAAIEAAPAHANVDDLIDEYERTRAEFAKGQWFTVEKRSSEWIEEFRTAKEAELGLKRVKGPDDAQAGLSKRDLARISLHQLAEQIVVPTDVTAASLQRLFDTNEGEFNKLMLAMIKANGELAQHAAGPGEQNVLTKDFSQRRSGSH